MSDFQQTVTLTLHQRRRLDDLREAIRRMDLAAPAALCNLNDTQLTRLALSIGIDTLVREHGIR